MGSLSAAPLSSGVSRRAVAIQLGITETRRGRVLREYGAKTASGIVMVINAVRSAGVQARSRLVGVECGAPLHAVLIAANDNLRGETAAMIFENAALASSLAPSTFDHRFGKPAALVELCNECTRRVT